MHFSKEGEYQRVQVQQVQDHDSKIDKNKYDGSDSIELIHGCSRNETRVNPISQKNIKCTENSSTLIIILIRISKEDRTWPTATEVGDEDGTFRECRSVRRSWGRWKRWARVRRWFRSGATRWSRLLELSTARRRAPPGKRCSTATAALWNWPLFAVVWYPYSNCLIKINK